MSVSLKNPFRLSHLVIVAIVLVAALVGAAMPIYVGLMGASAKLAAFPALLVFAFLFLYDRKLTLMLILLLRSSGDLFLEYTRFSMGGYQIGVGGLINACVILIALMLVVKDPRALPRKAVVAWCLFLLVVLYGVLSSPVKSEAMRVWLGQLSYFAVFASAFHFIRSKEDFRSCLKLVVWSSALPVLYSFVDIATHGSAGGPEGFRLQSTFGHANEFAFYLTLVITLSFYLLKSMPPKENGARRVTLGLYVMLLIALLLLTKTRSAWGVCFMSFVLYALIFERRYLLYLIALPIVGLLIPGVSDRIADLGQGNEVVTYARLNSFAWRLYLWESALQWTRPVNYLLGNGLQSFKEYSPIFFPLAGRVNWGAHSVYVQELFELGLVGFGTYLWLYWRVLQNLWSLLKIDRLGAYFLIVAVGSYLVSATSDNMLDYLSFNWYLWFSVGAGCALLRVSAKAAPAAASTARSAPPVGGSPH